VVVGGALSLSLSLYEPFFLTLGTFAIARDVPGFEGGEVVVVVLRRWES
jgi:hypothetical protein